MPPLFFCFQPSRPTKAPGPSPTSQAKCKACLPRCIAKKNNPACCRYLFGCAPKNVQFWSVIVDTPVSPPFGVLSFRPPPPSSPLPHPPSYHFGHPRCQSFSLAVWWAQIAHSYVHQPLWWAARGGGALEGGAPLGN